MCREWRGRSILIKWVLGSLCPHRAAPGIPSLPPRPGEQGPAQSLLRTHLVGGSPPGAGEAGTSGQEAPLGDAVTLDPTLPLPPSPQTLSLQVWASARPQDGTAPCLTLPGAASSVQGPPASSQASRSPRGPQHPLRGSPPPLPPPGPQNWSLPGCHACPFQPPLCSHRLRGAAACPWAASRWPCSCSLLLTEERR